MTRLVSCELPNEYVLIEIIQSEFDKHLSEISDAYNLFIVAFPLKFGGGLCIRPKHVLIAHQFRTDHRQDVLRRHVESCSHSSQVVKPGVLVDDSLVLLVEGEEIGEFRDLIRGYISCLELFKALAELLGHQLLRETRVVACQVKLFLVTSSFIWLIVSTTLVALFGDGGGVSEDNAKVKTLVDQSSLEVL